MFARRKHEKDPKRKQKNETFPIIHDSFDSKLSVSVSLKGPKPQLLPTFLSSISAVIFNIFLL